MALPWDDQLLLGRCRRAQQQLECKQALHLQLRYALSTPLTMATTDSNCTRMATTDGDGNLRICYADFITILDTA
ncbi:MAG: hypothetical protein MI924_16170 [Chloroflexales bacterium]|nr:hypothetical protein [Chloroflexales bacterium]